MFVYIYCVLIMMWCGDVGRILDAGWLIQMSTRRCITPMVFKRRSEASHKVTPLLLLIWVKRRLGLKLASIKHNNIQCSIINKHKMKTRWNWPNRYNYHSVHRGAYWINIAGAINIITTINSNLILEFRLCCAR